MFLFFKFKILACDLKMVCHPQRRQSGLKSGGSWIRAKKFWFCRKISEKCRFFQAISQTNSDFSGQISEKFRFLQIIKKNFQFSRQISEEFWFFRQFHKKFDFLGKFRKNCDFLRQLKKKSIFRANFWQISIF